MKIETSRIKDYLVLKIPKNNCGELTNNIDELIEKILKIDINDKSTIVLDFSKIDYLNSRGLGDLIRLKDIICDTGNKLTLLKISKKINSLISVTGLDEFFNIITDL